MRDSVRRVQVALAALLGVGAPGCDGASSPGAADAGEVGADHGGGTCKPKPANPDFDLASSCGVDTPLVVGGKDTGYATCASGVVHRPSVDECPNLLVEASPGSCTSLGSGFCKSLADCTGVGAHAACTHNDAGYCSCSSGCVADTDCPKGQICQCGPTIGTCTPARCTTDDDCDKGLLCVLSDIGAANSCNSCGQVFVCDSPSDACFSNSDCPSGCGTVSSCILIGDHHACSAECLYAVGRPFLVGTSARVAPVVDGRGWARGASPGVTNLLPSVRKKLAEAWSQIGQMEHASVAAFARFALDLLGLGAPADLVRWCQQAMSEEIDHAERAFALASFFGGRVVGPGPLDVGDALVRPDVKSVLRTVIREGCIGETVAAVTAAEALEQASEPAVRGALEIVARDETSHAALAWSAVRWLLERHGEALRPWLAGEFDVALRESALMCEESPDEQDSQLAAYGVLSARRQREVRHGALSRLVAPYAAVFLKASAAA